MEKSFQTGKFELGVCYYPEHWPEQLWDDDFRRMREMGFSVVRMAEFAWSIFEPIEGEFEFDLFDRAIETAHRHGIQVILGTPTATPPAWLTYKYPEVLNVSQNGVQYQHGQRRHYNYNSQIYRKLCARIAKEMAEHYKDHPAVIGWQIDNELNCEMNVFYSKADDDAFREWVQTKYGGDLDRLNKAWGTVFWNQTYQDWSQVHLTRPTVSYSPNPHQALDEKRFFSDSAISFCKLQADAIRGIVQGQWITTNGIFGHLDNHKMTKEALDFISYDSYPNFSTVRAEGERPLLDRKWSWNLSVVRSISPNFCVMEQQSGPGGWVNRMEMPSPKPGQMRLWTYQSIMHGADMLLYFRWRTATVGTEIYWHGIHNYDNSPNRRVQEAMQIGDEIRELGKRIVGTKYRAQAAIVKDYDNEWDGELDNWHGPYENQSILECFKAFQRSHIPVDALFMHKGITLEELLPYKLLIYPHPTIMPGGKAELLKEYTRQGGTIVFGCRSGYKNEFGHCYMTPMPGPLVELCGIEVQDFTMIGPFETVPTVAFPNDDLVVSTEIAAPGFNDIISVTSETAEVIASYTDRYYKGSAALTKNFFGKGSAFYYGAVFTEALTVKLLKLAGLASPLEGMIELPEQVELGIRENLETAERFIFLLNYSESEQTIVIHKQTKELISGKTLLGEYVLKSFDVIVLQESNLLVKGDLGCGAKL
ncbi:beta-galactosidase [Paenibacillus frigoriresistens]|uniref:beta-galactosidase n=1 Tax=Paenibacillus alginolyticus TaxID=59839 RepID=UPI001567751F|nr:beta-galactosidase [Paenibacillus frigoriresistens]NRF93781.1 beta-galactosidase [Paenibacillus frigoriresistens]